MPVASSPGSEANSSCHYEAKLQCNESVYIASYNDHHDGCIRPSYYLSAYLDLALVLQ